MSKIFHQHNHWKKELISLIRENNIGVAAQVIQKNIHRIDEISSGFKWIFRIISIYVHHPFRLYVTPENLQIMFELLIKHHKHSHDLFGIIIGNHLNHNHTIQLLEKGDDTEEMIKALKIFSLICKTKKHSLGDSYEHVSGLFVPWEVMEMVIHHSRYIGRVSEVLDCFKLSVLEFENVDRILQYCGALTNIELQEYLGGFLNHKKFNPFLLIIALLSLTGEQILRLADGMINAVAPCIIFSPYILLSLMYYSITDPAEAKELFESLGHIVHTLIFDIGCPKQL